MLMSQVHCPKLFLMCFLLCMSKKLTIFYIQNKPVFSLYKSVNAYNVVYEFNSLELAIVTGEVRTYTVLHK
jgi:hypothetical protein